MQSTHLINHSLELRLALSVVSIASLFAIVKLASFVDATLTAFLNRRKEMQNRPAISTSYAGAAAR